MEWKNMVTSEQKWMQFKISNPNTQEAFQEMCRLLFKREFVQEGVIINAGPNNPGVEVEPVPARNHNGEKPYHISFQAKFFEGRIGYSKFINSMKIAAAEYFEKLDCIYLFCNKPISTSIKSYKRIENILQQANMELRLITNDAIFDLLDKHQDVAERFSMLLQGNIETALKRLLQRNVERRESITAGRKIFDELLAPVCVEENNVQGTDLVDAVIKATNWFEKATPIILTAQGGQGKTTQLVRLWEEAEKKVDNAGNHNYIGLFCNLCQLEGKENLLEEILSIYRLPDEDYRCIIEDMKRSIDETGRHYILFLDGLDETNSQKVKEKISDFAQNNNGIQIIVAGRSNSIDMNTIAINMNLEKTKKDKIEEWIKNHHPENDKDVDQIYKRCSGNPMLLILAYETDVNLPLRGKSNTKYVEKSEEYVLRLGEVLWNYTEYLYRKYCLNSRTTEEEKTFAHLLLHKILPDIAHRYYYNKENLKGIYETDLKTEIQRYGIEEVNMKNSHHLNIDDAIQIINQTFSGLFHLDENDRYVFSHRFFADFYAMYYVSNLIKKVYEGKLLSDEEYKAITDIRIVESNEYYELMLCLLPFGFGHFSKDYEQVFLTHLNDCLESKQGNHREYNSRNYQILRYFRALYPYWRIYFYILNTDKEKKNSQIIKSIAEDGIGYMQDFVEIPEESELLLEEDCLSFVYYLLSQVYRTGSYIMSKQKESRISDFSENINECFKYTRKAVELCKRPEDVIDGNNYMMKVFLAAVDRILKHFYKNPDSEVYKLEKYDLIVNFREYSIFDYSFADHIPEKIANAKEGDVLSTEEVIDRIKCFNAIADDFLHRGAENKCVYSLNVVALNDEMEQEKKTKDDRCFVLSLDNYMQAVASDRAGGHYSASKAAQLLAQKKAGINDKGEVCSVSQEDEHKTIEKTVKMMETAALDSKYWKTNHWHKGELIINYHHNGEKELSELAALQEAYNEYSIAFSMMEKNVPVILALIHTGLELYKNTGIDEKIRKNICDALDKLGVKDTEKEEETALLMIIEKAKGMYHRDAWMPSFLIIDEYISDIKTYAENYKDEIHLLNLTDEFERCIAYVEEQEKMFEHWKNNEYPNLKYFKLLNAIK